VAAKYRVEVGRSWGSLTKSMQNDWDKENCNELLGVGKTLSCDERWGWQAFSNWRQNKQLIVSGQSDVECIKDVKTSTFCRMSNVSLDFSKAKAAFHTRSFSHGFLTTYGTAVVDITVLDLDIPALKHVTTLPNRLVDPGCSSIESRPTFVLSNDDIYNLGHYINDVMGIWSMAVLANIDTKNALLINFDGVRRGGPAGGPSHRLMDAGRPDSHGPYVEYYQSWFGEGALRKASDYAREKVCFTELYFMPSPGSAWFWNDWGRVSECTLVAASPLYQSFNLFLRKRWAAAYPLQQLAPPDIQQVHVVIEVRAINKSKTNSHSYARHIANLKELVTALQLIPVT
jgi:hypothetical protein